jgi:UDP-N-acetylmuramoylalanine--D-glutamate ligase
VGDARLLASVGADLLVTDLKSEEELRSSVDLLKHFSNITFHLGGHKLEDFQGRDLIIKAAGVPLDSPFIAEAKKHEIPVRMSADLFAQFAGIPIVGVTGTRGKSTVTHLLAHILETAGKEVLLGGNVKGISNLELLEKIQPQSIAVLELDSWQLQGFGEAKISPDVAVFTTFMPDHLNYYHNDMKAYFADKANIFLYQQESDTLVLGEQVGQVLRDYGYRDKIHGSCNLASEKDLPKQITLKIPGLHNRYNAGIATAAARGVWG